MRQGEDDMRIGDRQQFFGPFGEPLVTLPAVALWAMPIAAGFILDHLMGAVIALLYELAEGGGAARADVPEGFPLLGRQHVSPAFQKLLPVLAEDIGDFQPMLTHRWRLSSLERSRARSWSASKGLLAACSRLIDTCR